MDARAADALAIAVGHSLPSGLVEATAEIERLRARVAELQKDKDDLQREVHILEEDGTRMSAEIAETNDALDREQRLSLEFINKFTAARDFALKTHERAQRFEAEAEYWRHKYTQATLRQTSRRVRGPYARPSER